MAPPEKLRAELQRLRDRGYTFRQAWLPAVNQAIRGEPVQTAIFWRGVFNEQRIVWQVSFSRAPWPAHQRPTLIPLDDERSAPARPTGPAAVLA